MKKLFFVFSFMTFTIQCHSASNKLRCADGFGVNVCMLNENVTIDGSDFSFAVRDHRIEVLFFSPNRNVQFLPVKVANFFPHLQHYRASFCFIKVVLKENFKRLSELTILDLSHNFIVAIHDDTFDDLQNVDVIDLSDNGITYINGEIFLVLDSLISLKLTRNTCTNQNFLRDDDASELSDQCGFNKTWSAFSMPKLRVSCESFHSKICWMDDKTSIKTFGYKITPTRYQVTAMMLNHNKKIRYLPIRIHRVFAELERISAPYCSIDLIIKQNFFNLRNLQEINLNGNRIERITSNTFEGLTSLNEVDLRNNKIKFMNAALFNALDLSTLLLSGNLCTTIDYYGPIELNLNRCHFDDSLN